MSTIVGQVSGIPQWATGAIAVIAAAAFLIRTIYRGHARILSIKTPTSSRDRLELAVFKYERRLQEKTQRRCRECESHSLKSITESSISDTGDGSAQPKVRQRIAESHIAVSSREQRMAYANTEAAANNPAAPEPPAAGRQLPGR